MNGDPVVTRAGALCMQVCVPRHWTDEQVKHFADFYNSSGLAPGWSIRKQGNAALDGADERVPCAERPGFVHIMLDC